jgi:hypothetical protein
MEAAYDAQQLDAQLRDLKSQQVLAVYAALVPQLRKPWQGWLSR